MRFEAERYRAADDPTNVAVMTARANGATASVRSRAEEVVERAVAAALTAAPRVVLAVSGGRDSMALLEAALRARRGAVAAVATFDHGTGPSARDAVLVVRRVAGNHGVRVVAGRSRGGATGEAAWRAARWTFLREVAGRCDAQVATAHTRDDQIETVFIRALRGASARGLAGLYAASDVVRPLLDVSRADVAEYAASRRLEIVDDPSNASRRFLRNRVRLDILPALETARPGFGDELLAVSRRAAACRAEIERWVDALAPRREGSGVYVAADPLLALTAMGRALVWPAIAARAGVVLDRRATARLAEFTGGVTGRGRVPLAGGHEVVRHRHAFEVRASAAGRTTG